MRKRMSERKKIVVNVGTSYKVSQVGYYNFWYPSEDVVGRTDRVVCGEELRWLGGGDKWIPVHVTQEDASRYGSPIRVIWFLKEEIYNV